MPLPVGFLASSAVQAGMDVAKSIPNALMAHLTNVKNRKEARVNYNRQREDALSDWNMNNAYNSPKAQMERFKEAGLNPNLMYGQMTTAAPVRSSEQQTPRGEAPQVMQNPSMSAIAYTASQAQIDNVKAATDTEREKQKQIKALTLLAGIQGGKTDAEMKKIMQDMGFDVQLFPLKQESMIQDIAHKKADTQRLTVEASKGLEQIKEIKQQIINLADSNKRANELQKGILSQQEANIANTLADTLKKEAETANTKQELVNLQLVAEALDYENFVKELHAYMAKNGIDPTGPSLLQAAEKLLREDKTKYKSKREKFYQPQPRPQLTATDSKQ